MHTHRQHRQQANVPSLTDEVETELAKYLAAPCQLRASDPLTWWRDNTARFLFSVMPLDITWQPLRLACLVSVSSATLVSLLMTSEHVYWLKISNAWFFLKQT